MFVAEQSRRVWSGSVLHGYFAAGSSTARIRICELAGTHDLFMPLLLRQTFVRTTSLSGLIHRQCRREGAVPLRFRHRLHSTRLTYPQ